MKCSIKHNPIGKPNSDYPKSKLTHGWLSANVTPSQLVQHIEAGKPFAIAHYKDGHRLAANFIASDLIALDIDGNDGTPLTTQEYERLLQDPFITQYAFAVVQSASSQPNAYKARILFRLDETITDPAHYKQLVEALMARVNWADPACKDAARFFFGGQPGRKADFLDLNNILETYFLEDYIAEKASEPAKPTESKPFMPRLGDSPTEERALVEQALAYLPDTALAYDEWLSVLMALSTLPYGLELAEQWTSDTQMGLPAKFASFTQGAVTLGTLFHLAQQYGFRFPAHIPYFDLRGLDALPEDAPSLTLNTRYLSEQLGHLSQPVIAIKSPIGTGKTEWLLGQLKDAGSVLQISHRRSLVANAAHRQAAEGLEVHTYTSLVPHKWPLPNNVITTSNSLYKLMSRDAQLPTFDVIVLDEVEQGLAHLVGNTFKGAAGHQTFLFLVGLIRKAKKVIVSDADLGDLTLNFLKFACNNEPIYLVHNTYTMQRGPMTVYLHPSRALQDALVAIQAGQRVAIACDSRDRAQSVYELLQQQGIAAFCITGENSDHTDSQAFLADINNRINELQAFVYTSSVGTGVDIQADVEAVFGLFDNRSITPQEQLQLIGRCRNAKRWVIGALRVDGQASPDPEEIRNYYLSNLDILADMGVMWDWTERRDGYFTPAQLAFLELVVHVEAQRNARLNHALNLFIYLARREYTVTIVEDDPSDPSLLADIKEARQAVKNKRKAATLKATPVNDKDYRLAKETGRASPAIENGHRRYTIEEFYQSTITPAIYDHASDQGMFYITNFIHFHRTPDELRRLDQIQINKRTDINRLSLLSPKFALIHAVVNELFPDGLHDHRIPIKQVMSHYGRVLRLWETMNGPTVFARIIRAKTPRGIVAGLLRQMGLIFKQEWSNKKGFYRLRGGAITRYYSLRRLWGLDEMALAELVAETFHPDTCYEIPLVDSPLPETEAVPEGGSSGAARKTERNNGKTTSIRPPARQRGAYVALGKEKSAQKHPPRLGPPPS